MADENLNGHSRRSFLKHSAIGAAAFTIVKPELVRGAGKEKIRAGLIGCGGRGTQAVVNLLSGDPGAELVAMGDIFADHLEASLAHLQDEKYIGNNTKSVAQFTQKDNHELAASVKQRVKVDRDHQFVGFDAFKKVIASDIDVVMLCTPPGYRPAHFEAAIEGNRHVFFEKPIATDPVGVRRFLAAARKAEEKKLVAGSGAQRRSTKEFIETVDKIHNGEIGDIRAVYSKYLSGPVMHVKARDPKWGEMEWQHRNWYSFVWICGDQIVEQHFHNIDCINWVMGGHPDKVVASGGASWRPREELYGNIYDHLTSEFTYPNGIVYSSACRQYPNGLYRKVEDLIVGTKGKSNAHDMAPAGLNGQVQEHINLLAAIRGDRPYFNHGVPVAESTMTAIMARESAYSGLEITWDQVMKSDLDLQPKEFDYNLKMAEAPLPVPGTYKFV